tara:strand:- start:525 stop:1472 length:948 start_codon:yes stop_codon:yes gene_type:complete
MAKKKTKKKSTLRRNLSDVQRDLQKSQAYSNKKMKARAKKIAKYAKENPLEAASIAAMAVPVVGWGAAAGLRGAALAGRAWKARGAIKTGAKKAASKVKSASAKAAKTAAKKTKPARKKVGSKLRTVFGPKHKKAGKVYSTRRGAEMGRAGSKQHKVVRKEDKVTKGYKGKEIRKKQYRIEPTGRAAATSKKALFTYGAAGYVGSQLMSDKTSKPKKKSNGGGGVKPPKGYNPGSVASKQGQGTGSWKDRRSAGPNAIARKIKKAPPKKGPVIQRKYKNGTGGGDRPTSKAGPHLSEVFRRRLGGQRKPGSRGGY